MEKYVEIIERNFGRYFSKPYYFYYMIAAITFILIRKNAGRKQKMLGLYSMVTLVVFLNPVFCRIFWEFLRDGGVYWRLIWLIPSTVLIAWAGVELITFSKKKLVEFVMAVLVVAAIAWGGTLVYKNGAFTERTNWEKIPEITAVTMDVINKNAEETGNPYKRLAAPVDILCQIRQLDATILQHGHREMKPMNGNEHKFKGYYYKLMDGYIKDYNHWIGRLMRAYETNYLVFPTTYGLSADVKKNGGKNLYDDGTWEIWYFPRIKNTKHEGEYFWLEEE